MQRLVFDRTALLFHKTIHRLPQTTLPTEFLIRPSLALLLSTLVFVLASSTASAAFIMSHLALRDAGLTTNPLIYSGAFDVYDLVLSNPNSGATAVELSLPGNFIQVGSTTFKAGTDLPVAFGFDAPDTFFVLPDGVNPNDVLGVDTFDDATGLGSSFVVAGGVEIIPPGQSVIAVISVPIGTVPDAIGFFGRAIINGQFENIGYPTMDPCDLHPYSPECPEPTTALLAALGVVGISVRRRS